MADNINVDPGTGGSAVPVATDEVSGAHYQIIKMAVGVDGVATIVSSTDPLPVGGSLIGATNETMAANDTAAAGLNGRLQRIAANLTAYLSGKFTGLPTTLGAGGGLKVDGSGTPIPVSGTVTVNGIATTAPDRGAGVTTTQTLRVSIASEQVEGGEYEDVAASQASTTLGATGAAGDFLSSITFFPESVNPGAVTLQDGALTAVTVFFGGTGSVSNLVPFTVAFGNTSADGAWKVVTGAAIHIRASGNFT